MKPPRELEYFDDLADAQRVAQQFDAGVELTTWDLASFMLRILRAVMASLGAWWVMDRVVELPFADRWERVAFLIVGVGGFFWYNIAGFRRARRDHLRAQLASRGVGVCPECGYCLRTASPRCPECGAAVTPPGERVDGAASSARN